MKSHSKTDWERVKREAEQNAPIPFDPSIDPYNPNDAQAVEAYWAGAVVKQQGVAVGRVRGPGKHPLKEQVSVRYSPDVLAAFRATGRGWQTRMDEALRDWLKSHSPT